MSNQNLIVVAEGHEEDVGDWSVEWDAAEWDAMTVRKRTDIICAMFLTQFVKRVKRQEEADHLYHMNRFITDERLKRLTWEAWQMVPKLEQEILRALFLKIRNGHVEGGLACIDTWEPSSALVIPAIEITVDLDKVAHGSDDEVINSILHEFVHAAYRHSIIQYWFKQGSASRAAQAQEHFDWLTDTQAVILARAWQDAAASGDSAVS